CTRKDIVEHKKPDEKKPDEKKEDKKPGEASAEGKVTFKGKPLGGGTITFVPAEGPGIKGQIAADGSYKVAELKPGEYKVTIETESLKDKEGYVAIPAKYSNA